MRLKYEMPFVEVIDFLAKENLANTREQIEARDNGAAAQSGDGGGVGNPSIEGGWEEW